METPMLNLRRPIVYCIRDFPSGCGPGAAVASQRKPEEKPPCPAPAQPLPPPPSPATGVGQLVDSGDENTMAVDITSAPPCPAPVHPLPFADAGAVAAAAELCQAANSDEGNPMADGDADGSVLAGIVISPEEKNESSMVLAAVVNEKTSGILAIETSTGFAKVTGQDVTESQGITDSPEEDAKLKALEPLENISESSQKITGTVEPAESMGMMEAGGARENMCYSKLYPPPRRRKISAVRDYPIGCGWNAAPMSREECFKLVEESVRLPREKNPSPPKNLNEAKVPADLAMVETELKLATDVTLSKNQYSEGENKTVMHKEEASVQALDRAEVHRDEVMGTTGDLKVPSEIFTSKDEGRHKEMVAIVNEQLTPTKTFDKVNSNLFLEETSKQMEPRQNKQVQLIEEAPGDHEDPDMAPPVLPKGKSFETEKKRTLKQVQEDERCFRMLPKSKLMQGAREVAKQNSQIKGMHKKDGDPAVVGGKKILSGQLPAEKLDVPVLHQAIKVSQIEDARSSKSPHPVAGSHSRSDAKHMERKIPPSSTSQKLQNSKGKDIELIKRKFSDKVKDESQQTNNLKTSIENSKVFGNRVIVQALMAAPNCPWMHGRRSGASGSRPVAGKTKLKSEKPLPREEIALLDFEDKEGHLHAHGEDERDKTALALYEGSNNRSFEINQSASSASTAKKAKVKRDRTPFPKQPVLFELEDKEDSFPECGQNENALVLYEGSNDRSENINPIVPSGSSARKVKAVKRGRAPLHKQLASTEFEGMEDSLVNHEESESDQGSFSLFEGSKVWSVNITPIVPPYSCSGNSDVAARQKVRNSLRLFQAVCRKVLHCQEAQKNDSEKIKRIDLTAYKILKGKCQWPTTGEPIFGDVPGVEVGDEFQFRVELAMVGLHRPFQGGIDFAKKGNTYIALSVVASGGYPDDMDSSDVLIYSGSGGNPGGTNKNRIPEDQKLQRGNLALKNSIDTKTPVRVIHGFKEGKASSSHDSKMKLVSTFTYAGLYLVEEYWQEKGPHGFKVFRYKLRKIPGQPELALQIVKRTKKLKVREGLCIKDISGGKERIPICVINTIDDDRPMPFNYITKIKYPSWYINTPPSGCDCTGGCSDSAKCVCARKNGGEIPYNFNGAIVQAKKLVFECGPSCKCPSSCHNRVSQHGIKIPLEIFKTERRGWGVRSLYSIPSGSFICEYIGELLQDEEAERRSNDEYLFDIGQNYDDPSLWKDLPDHMVDPQASSSPATVDSGYTIDAAEQGNVGRFINHSCSPNLYAQNVLYDHDDKRMPHVMLFAADNIPPLQELTYHYNYTIDGFRDSEGNIKKKACYCGSAECCGRLY